MNGATADQPATDFTEPAPVTKIADQSKRDARQGFEVGRRLRPVKIDRGPGAASVDELPPLTADEPSATTSTSTTVAPATQPTQPTPTAPAATTTTTTAGAGTTTTRPR